ncbi:hypothetical protein LCGC14_0696060 [marine sediment metagenome]|uniref:Gelsolin-like domain-containing protein n=1 Tax=marine sediment metagenome TaxID=412755 RepID=A0A0F9QJ65_9ZZZZ
MQLFKIDDKGELLQLHKLSFEKNDVYLVDDDEKNTIYIWVGNLVPKGKRDITAELARKLDKSRSAKILIMKQMREYGSFLSMMHDLEKGHIPGKTIERRHEFRFEGLLENERLNNIKETSEKSEDVMESRIEEWLAQTKKHRKSTVEEEKIEESKEKTETEENLESDLKTQVKEVAYFLSLKKYSYNDLCWILAEKIQKMNLEMPSIEDIKQKAKEVFNSSCTYDELCWLNAEMDILTKKSLLQEQKRKLFDY